MGFVNQDNSNDLWVLEFPIRIEFVRIPTGEFLMGSDKGVDKDADDHELPQHSVYLDEYWMGRYPVTVEQFAEYLKGADKERYRGWKKSNKEPDHPAVEVSCHDAVALCKWLTQTVEGIKPAPIFRLPTEAEWEMAARGTDGRIYPWGNDWDPGRLNSKEGGSGGTTPVGGYSPRGDSPYGCADVEGNVWEWCADLFGIDYYSESPHQNPQGPASSTLRVVRSGSFRVVRGGSFRSNRDTVRCASRVDRSPLIKYYERSEY